MSKRDSIDVWVHRQKNKPRLQGVHERIMPHDPGVSVAGSYLQGYGSNVETCKRLHREKLRELISMPKPKLGGAS